MNKFFLSAIITITFLATGIILLNQEIIGYGVSLFVFLPFLLGYILGNPTTRKLSFAGLAFSLLIFFILLIAGNLEGMICILMAMPLVAIAVGLGFLIKYISTRNKTNEDHRINPKLAVLPLIVFILFGMIENQLTKHKRNIIEVASEIILPYNTMQVYDAIKSVDTLDAEKPFLMRLDLPVPLKCVLEAEKVGALRTCYFEGGTIVERITELEPGKLLKMDVIDYELTGRAWLGFEQAIYIFENLPNGHCKMTRITTYTSALYPRFYWEPLERLGIGQEHEYVFRNLEKDLDRIVNN